MRSLRSMITAAAQPAFSSPTTASAGRRTLSKNTSLNGASPVACFSGRTVTPGSLMSRMNMVMPLCLGTVVSVRAIRAP